MTASGEKGEGAKAEKDARWPFVALYFVMWAGMIGTSLNEDPIKFNLSFAVVFGFIAILGIVIVIAASRYRGASPFAFVQSTVAGNLAWHIFILTGIVFITFLFFDAFVQIMVLKFNAPVFQSGCEKISERDVSLFVWEAMAKGALKFVASYAPLPAGTCAPDTGTRITVLSALVIRWFTALVVVWYVIGLGKSWYFRTRKPDGASS
ncbi:MAG: hypothetical protein WA384_15910 [Rhodomicrobium sp.]